jgi:Macrocin-O-methyltransferase (TylF)/Coenzyme PQQ synthesis protein D (PqqD)
MPFRAVAVQATAAEASIHLLSPQTGEWIALTGTARQIWERLEYPATSDDVAADLAAQYEAPLDLIREDVSRALADLQSLGLVAEAPNSPADPLRNRYLSLLKRALGNMLYAELELQMEHMEGGAGGLTGASLHRYQRDISAREADRYAGLIAAKLQGNGPLRYAHTMIGQFRLSNIERCAEQVIAEGIPGDFLEAGVCKGGAAIFMRALQVAHGAPERLTWVVDSFAGCPPSEAPGDAIYNLHLEEGRVPWLACSEEQVRAHFQRYDLLDSNVCFLSGWLADTLPTAPVGPLAILRVDVDLYSSTAQCLDLLYDRVSPGGFVIVDDYGHLTCCRDAVDDFRRRRGVDEPIRWIDGSGIYWRKGEGR